MSENKKFSIEVPEGHEVIGVFALWNALTFAVAEAMTAHGNDGAWKADLYDRCLQTTETLTKMGGTGDTELQRELLKRIQGSDLDAAKRTAERLIASAFDRVKLQR